MKSITLLLLVLMVSIQTPLRELFKFPLLVEHYIKHQRQQGISLIDFLEMHYATDHNDADRPEDERLPFKNITFNSVGYAVVTSVIQVNAAVPLPAAQQFSFRNVYSPQQHLAGIFHPPRV